MATIPPSPPLPPPPPAWLPGVATKKKKGKTQLVLNVEPQTDVFIYGSSNRCIYFFYLFSFSSFFYGFFFCDRIWFERDCKDKKKKFKQKKAHRQIYPFYLTTNNNSSSSNNNSNSRRRRKKKGLKNQKSSIFLTE